MNERGLGVARRRAGTLYFSANAEPLRQDAKVRSVGVFVAALLGKRALSEDVARAFYEAKRHGRDSRVSCTNQKIHAVMLRVRRTEHSKLTDRYFEGIWRLLGEGRPASATVTRDLRRCLYRIGLAGPAYELRRADWQVDSFAFDASGHVLLLQGRYVRMRLEISYLDRLTILGYLYLLMLGSGQLRFQRMLRTCCERLIESPELDQVFCQEDAETLRASYRRKIVAGAGLGDFPSVNAGDSPFPNDFVWMFFNRNIALVSPRANRLVQTTGGVAHRLEELRRMFAKPTAPNGTWHIRTSRPAKKSVYPQPAAAPRWLEPDA